MHYGWEKILVPFQIPRKVFYIVPKNRNEPLFSIEIHFCFLWHGRYRLTVIKNLPYLEKLDDVKIEPEERQDATRRGKILTHPEESDRIEEAEENYFPAPSAIVVSKMNFFLFFFFYK